MRLLTFKMGWLLGVNVVNNMYTGFRLSSTQQPGWSAQLGNQNISHQYWWTSTGCVSKRESSTNSVSWCLSASTAWRLRISLSSYNRSRSWSHDSASDLPARQRSSCQQREGQRSVTDLSLLPAPGLGIVCRALSLRRPLCHHSVDTWNLICSQCRFHNDDNFS